MEFGKLNAGKFEYVEGNLVFLYIKTHSKLWENWLAEVKLLINLKIFSSPGSQTSRYSTI